MDESLDREPSSVLNNLLNAGPQSRLSTGGFHLNYNKEAPVLHIDIGGPDQQLQWALSFHALGVTGLIFNHHRMAKFITTSIEKESNGWSVKDAMEKLGLQMYVNLTLQLWKEGWYMPFFLLFYSEEDLLPGLDVRLLRHQVIGVAWLVNLVFIPNIFWANFARMLEKEHSADRGGILAWVLFVTTEKIIRLNKL